MANRKNTKLRSGSSPLSGRIALITGASRGIGLAMARALAAQGCDLVLTARDMRSLEKAGREVERLGARVLLQGCDVRDPDAVRALAASVKKQLRRLDIVINNAGVAHPARSVEKLPYEVWQDVVDINLTGMFLVTQACLPLMKRGGVIVNNLSIAATQVFANSSAYCASKHGARGLTNALREELRPRGIRVVALLAGATDTDIWKVLWAGAPRRKMMSAETVADSVVCALTVPERAAVEELKLLPLAGTL